MNKNFSLAVVILLLFFSVPCLSVKAEETASPWFLNAINAPDGWESLAASGADFSEPVIVAVIDTGCDYTHPLIAGALWENTAEKDGTPGVDDDGNGYADDIYGIDTCNYDSDPMDDSTGAIEGHGTHVAGAVLQSAGVTETENPFNIRIMPIKAGNAYGDFNASELAEAIRYAVDNGASVINMSISSEKYPLVLREAIEYASARAILVASAGNKGVPTSDSGYSSCGDYYPAGSSFVAGVMSHGKEYTLSSFSNWDFASGSGAEYEIAAPGEAISSCTYGAAYKAMSGTSMASGIVSGCATLLCARYRDSGYSARELTAHLMNCGTEDIAYTDLYGNSHTFPGIRLDSLLSKDICPALTVTNASIENDGDAVTFSYSLKNRGSDAHALSAALTCDLPDVSIIPGEPLPENLEALSQYEGSFLLSLPEGCKEVSLVLQISYEDADGNLYTLSHSISASLENSPEPEEPVIPLLGISVSSASPLLIQPGETRSLLVTYIPENTTADRTVAFSSSNPLIASVDADGIITAHAEGSASITTVSSAGHVRTVNVTVYVRPENTNPAPDTDTAETEAPPADAGSTGTDTPPATTDAPGTDASPADTSPISGAVPVKGQVYTVNHMKYRVTLIRKDAPGSATLVGTTRKRSKLTALNIKDTVTICGKTFRVTGIGARAFRGYSRLRRVKFGKYIKVIKKEAFRNCRRLTRLTLCSPQLRRIGKNALKGISPEAVIRVPASGISRCRKLLKKMKIRILSV